MTGLLAVFGAFFGTMLAGIGLLVLIMLNADGRRRVRNGEDLPEHLEANDE